ncbi:hypothetical protein EV175_007595, partial [Coemansia sp. RSA 1933]
MTNISALRSDCDALRRSKKEAPLSAEPQVSSSKLPSVPPRKRTRAEISSAVSGSKSTSPTSKKSGPMSLAFVINGDSSSHSLSQSKSPQKHVDADDKPRIANSNNNHDVSSEEDSGIRDDTKNTPTGSLPE